MSKIDDLRKKSKKSRDKADALTDEDLETLIDAREIDLEMLRPEIADEETYEALITIVKSSIKRNESLATLKERIEKLGAVGLKVVKEIIDLI